MSWAPRAAAVAALLAAAPLAAASPPSDDSRFEVSAFAGAHFFSSTVELGVPNRNESVHPQSGVGVGGRFRYWLAKSFAVEAELLAIPTEDSGAGARATVLGWRAHIVVPLGYFWGPLDSQVVAGFGALTVFGDGQRGDPNGIHDDTDPTFHWGVTGRWKIGPRLLIRGDLRHLLPPSTQLFPVTSDFEIQLGAAYRFGT